MKLRVRIIASIVMAAAVGVVAPASADLISGRGQNTAFFNLAPINCEKEFGEKTSSALRSRLPAIDNLYLVSTGFMKAELGKKADTITCQNDQCAVSLGRRLRCQRVIIGSIKRLTKEETELKGDTGQDKYLYLVKNKYTYLIQVSLIDSENKSVVARLDEITKNENTDEAIKKIVERLAEFFHPRAGAPRIAHSLALSFSSSIPHGGFRRSARAGLGFLVDYSLTDLGMPHMTLKFFTGYNYILPSMKAIKRFNMVHLGAMGGYELQLHPIVRLTPAAGGGYLFHFIYGDTSSLKLTGISNYSTKIYYDPFATFRCELAVSLTKGFYFIFTPGYTVFFERSSIGLQVTLDAGARYYF
jgi:hypothetical protein